MSGATLIFHPGGYTVPGGGGGNFVSDPVTTARNATGSGTRYDVTTDAELAAIEWNKLVAGDVVNIFWKSTPYKVNFGLRAQATEANPVIINGVTDSSGNRPIIDGDGSTTAAGVNSAGGVPIFNTSIPEFQERLGVIVITRGTTDDYFGPAPQWIELRNLQVQGARDGASGTQLNAGTYTRSGCAGIYLLLVEHCLIENCVITDNANGLFTMAKDNLFSQACKYITTRACRIFGNGVVGSFFRHNVYMQCHEPITEYCYIGPQRAGAIGSCYKSRSSGEIFRFNYAVGNARTLDLAHSEEQDTDGIVRQSSYGIDYVYGNIIVADSRAANGAPAEPLHYGGDNLGEDGGTGDPLVTPALPYRSQLYFFNNTYFVFADTANNYYTRLFAIALKDLRVDAWDNVFVIDGDTNVSWVEFAGQLTFRGTNLLYYTGGTDAAYTDIQNALPSADATKYTVTQSGTLLRGNPNLVDPSLTTGDYSLNTGSAALNEATGTPSGLPGSFVSKSVNGQFVFPSGGESRATVTDLGALEA